MSDQAQMEMPKYQCHKKVHALKIAGIDRDSNGALLTPVDRRYSPFRVSQEYVQKHQPKAGGYYVVYKGGYISFSPAEAFEDGYTLIE